MQGDIVVELVGSATSGETWYFNDTIGYPDPDTLNVNFTSNGAKYTAMKRINYKFLNYLSYENESRTATYDYSASKWPNEAYRTIVLDEPATGKVLAFLEANATKIS